MIKKNIKKTVKGNDDTLFGLLSAYKFYTTYVKILESEDERIITILLTDNPGNWRNIDAEKYKSYRELRRLEIGCDKLSIKYIYPEHIVKIIGPLMGIKIPSGKVKIEDELTEKKYYVIEAPVKYKKMILTGVNKILKLTPQKRYEILEKFIIEK